MTTNAYHPFFNPKGIVVMLFIFMLGGLAGAVAFSDLFGSRTVELEEIVIMPAQEEETPAMSGDAFIIVERMPELIGGLSALQQELRYPAIAKRAGIEGRVFVQFIVDERGHVEDAQVVRGIGAGCDEEAVRAVQQMRFVPGRQRGKAVRVKMSLPVTFRLAGNTEFEYEERAVAEFEASRAASDEAFVIVEQMPELIGGLSALQQELRYPAIAKRAGIEGRVFVQFIIDKEGRVEDAQVVRGIGAGCDEEAVRAVLQMRFVPGRQRGEAVRVKMSLPVIFRLNNAVEARVDSAVIDASARFQPENGTKTLNLHTENGLVPGTVLLSSNGNQLREGTDYTVDYEAGTLTISSSTYLTGNEVFSVKYDPVVSEETEVPAQAGGVLVRSRRSSQN
jgi:TonB family protein